MTAEGLNRYFAANQELWKAFLTCAPVLEIMIEKDMASIQEGTDDASRQIELATFRVYSKQLKAFKEFIRKPIHPESESESLVPHGH